MITLYEHQKKGKNRLLTNKKYCLFYEVGTGKTYTALSALEDIKESKKVLIVAPKRVLNRVWVTSTEEFNLNQHNITFINYEKVARDKTFTHNKYDIVILDEVHKLKGRTTKTSKKFKIINENAEYVWGLTGTPVANNYADVYNIYTHMGIHEFMMSYDEFVWKYYYTKQLQSQSGFRFELLVGVKPHMKEELMSRIGKHASVVRAKDCIDLPDKRIDIRYIDGMVTDKYKELQKGILKTDDYEKTMIQLEVQNKLHQASNGFYYDDYGKANIICENKKWIELNNILEGMLEETERVIIVYYYKQDLIDLKKLNYAWTTNPDEFPEKQILFIQYNQSEGLNLQYCNQMIYYTYDYSFLNYEQMCGRIYRNGQKNNVVYTILINKKTIEETIWWAISNKKSRDEYLKKVIGDYDG